MLDQFVLLKKGRLVPDKNLPEQFFGTPSSARRSIQTVRRIFHVFHVTTLAAKRATIIDPYWL